MHQPPSGSGTIPLQEYRRDVPPGWAPGNPSYQLREYLEKLRLWYRVANVDDEMIGPLVAGRLYGRAAKIAMALRVPRPDGTMDVGDAVEGVVDPMTGQIIQQHVPSGMQYLVNALRNAFGEQDQDLATQSLERFFSLQRGKMSLAEYNVEFETRFDEAHGRAGLVMNDVAKFYPFFKNSGLSNKTIDDIKLQVQAGFARFADARTLALDSLRTARKQTEATSSMPWTSTRFLTRPIATTGLRIGTTMMAGNTTMTIMANGSMRRMRLFSMGLV